MSKIRILVVDDQLAMRNMVSHILETNGEYTVCTANDGEDAYREATKRTYDMIITDINMPKMDGFSLAKKLRGLSKYKSIPILILSTENSQAHKKRGRESGASAWIVKPIRGEVLLPAVQKLLN